MTDKMREDAIREAARNTAVDEHFEARPHLMRTRNEERLFEAGFDRAWQAAQSVPVVGDVVAWLQYRDHSGMRPTTIHLCDSDSKGAFEVIRKPAHSITSAELASLREKAAMADELRKDAEKWRDLCSRVGADPSGTIAYAGPLEGAPEDWAAIAQEGE